MNIRELIEVVRKTYPNLKLEFHWDYSTDKGNAVNIKSSKDAFRLLSRTSLMQSRVDKIWDGFFSNYDKDKAEITKPEYHILNDHYKYLQVSIESLHDNLKDFLPEEFDNSVRIKLPETVNFQDLSKITNDLNKSLSIPIRHDSIKGDIEIKSVENGSIWIIVALGTPLAVGLIGGIAWASAVIHKKRQEAKLFEEHVKTLKIANDQKAIFLEAQKEQIQTLIESEANHLKNNHYQNSNNEDVERLKMSIVTIADLINKGLEIHPSLMATEQVDNLFPDFRKLDLIQSKVKQITEGEETA